MPKLWSVQCVARYGAADRQTVNAKLVPPTSAWRQPQSARDAPAFLRSARRRRARLPDHLPPRLREFARQVDALAWWSRLPNAESDYYARRAVAM